MDADGEEGFFSSSTRLPSLEVSFFACGLQNSINACHRGRRATTAQSAENKAGINGWIICVDVRFKLTIAGQQIR